MQRSLDPTSMNRPPHLDEILKEAKKRDWPDLESLNRWIQAQFESYNQRPQAELGGLSPVQVEQLLAGDWESHGPLQFSSSLSPADLRHASFPNNARVFLAALDAEGPVKATATNKNLPRKFIGAMVERMTWDDDYIDKVRYDNKVIDELDLYILHILRVVLQVSGLIKFRSGKFSITAAGKRLIPEERAVERYAHLFRSYFREFNITYADGIETDNPPLQHTMAVTLYRFSREKNPWRRAEGWAERLLLKEVLDQPDDYTGKNAAYAQFELRVLEPLKWFGLVECRTVPGEQPWRADREYRKSPLFDRVLEFHF